MVKHDSCYLGFNYGSKRQDFAETRRAERALQVTKRDDGADEAAPKMNYKLKPMLSEIERPV